MVYALKVSRSRRAGLLYSDARPWGSLRPWLLFALILACVLQPTSVAWLFRLGVMQPYPWANTMSLQSVSMVSADNGWAVGHISGKPTTLLMHYSRGQWTILPKPVGLDDTSAFTAVSMVSGAALRPGIA